MEKNQRGLLGFRFSQTLGLIKVVMMAKKEQEETTSDDNDEGLNGVVAFTVNG